jgi:hypothetical protein
MTFVTSSFGQILFLIGLGDYVLRGVELWLFMYPTRTALTQYRARPLIT